MIASYFGGQVKTIEGHIGTRHKVFGVIEGEVNSFHSQGLKDLPNGFDALARSIDGDLEAIRHKTLQIEGWMWHPEREPNFHRRDIRKINGSVEMKAIILAAGRGRRIARLSDQAPKCLN